MTPRPFFNHFLLSTLLIFTNVASASQASPTDCKTLLNSQELDHIVAINRFTTGRGFAEYLNTFGSDFQDQLWSFRGQNRWLDSGAGEARAQRAFLATFQTRYPQLKTPELVAAVVSRPGGLAPDIFPEELLYLEGRYLEDIPTEELGRFDIITDLFGALSYSTRIDLLLKTYLKILKPQGRLYFSGDFIKLNTQDASLPTTIVTAQGRRLNLISWLKTIEGLEIRRIVENHSRLDEAYELTVLPGHSPQIPALQLIALTAGSPPQRVFQELE